MYADQTKGDERCLIWFLVNFVGAQRASRGCVAVSALAFGIGNPIVFPKSKVLRASATFGRNQSSTLTSKESLI